MATLIRNLQAPVYNPDVPTDATMQQQLQSLEQNLVARETTRFYEEYFKNQQQVQLDTFATNVAKKMYSTTRDQVAAAALDIQSTCTTFQTQAHALKTTANTLALVRARLDEQIAQQVEAAGADATPILEKYIAKAGSELYVAETKRDDVQSWLTTLHTLRNTAVREAENRLTINGSAGFGARFTNPEAMRQNVQQGGSITEEILTDVRVTQPANAEAFGEETASGKASRRHR